LPMLRRGHDRDAEFYGGGIIYMLLLRFVVALVSPPLLRCTSAHRCIRVLTPLPLALAPLSAHTPTDTCGPVNNPHPAFSVRRSLRNSRLAIQLAFKSHSAPRPPQTPAASSQSPHRKRLGSTLIPRRSVLPEAFPIKASDKSGVADLIPA
jgi:hypothetical protein